MFQPVEDLPVRRLYMVGLVERLHCQLPVARQRDGSIPAEAQLLEFIVPATLVDGIEELLKRFRVVIHVDEREAAPDIDLRLGEPNVLVLEAIAPILPIDHQCVVAVQIPAPAVESTNEFGAAELQSVV